MSLIQTTQEWLVRKRDGRVVPFDVERIEKALRKAFRADQGLAADLQAPLAAMRVGRGHSVATSPELSSASV